MEERPAPGDVGSDFFIPANIPAFDGRLDLAEWPEEVRGTCRVVCELWHLEPPRRIRKKGGEFAAWIVELRELADACRPFRVRQVLELVYCDWNRALHEGKGFTVGRPGALVRVARAKVGEMRADDDEAYRRRYLTGSLVEDE